jgi:hypothetical protein
MNARTASWGRVTAGTVALFAVVLAFLAGRVHAGGDPTQAKAKTPAPAVTTTTTQQPVPEEDQAPEPAPLTTQQS